MIHYTISQRFEKWIASCKTYEQLTACEALASNYRRLYHCQQVQRDYEGIVLMIDKKRAAIARNYRPELKALALPLEGE